MGVVIITGVPGVGKSTVIGLAKETAGYPVVVYGDEMIRVAQARSLAKDRDEMRRLDPAIQKEIQEEAAKAIAKMGNVILDTHCTIKTPKGYLPGIPSWVAERLKPKQVILVEAPPEDVLRRRASDATRKRDLDTAEVIAEHQAMNRAQAMAVAHQTGATVLVIVNREGLQQETKAALVKALA